MKPFLHVLLTALVVGGGIAVYHVTVADAPKAADEPLLALSDRDLSALEARVAALEDRAPILLGASTPDDLVARIRVLEEKLAARAPAPARAGVTEEEGRREPTPGAAEGGGDPFDPATVPAEGGEALTPAQREQIRAAVDTELQRREDRRMSGMLQRRLDELGIELDETQRQKLTEALAAHRETARETFRTAREAGLDRDQMRDQMTTLNQKLTESLSTFMAAADAEAVASSLGSSVLRGPRGGGRGGRD